MLLCCGKNISALMGSHFRKLCYFAQKFFLHINVSNIFLNLNSFAYADF